MNTKITAGLAVALGVAGWLSQHGCMVDAFQLNRCGDGVMSEADGEACDDGNGEDGDGCSAMCQIERCGNGVLEAGEVCDDGNTTDGDGCSADCRSDETCGNGVVDAAVGEICDDGNVVDGDFCGADCMATAEEGCGNGILEPGEACDDGNTDDNGGCSATCRAERTVVAGGAHTCALLDAGAVRCWGWGSYGRLGYANTNNIGDDETPASADDIDVGGTLVHIAAGGNHTCALLDTGTVRCWGYAFYGQLGYGKTDNIGDDETPASAGDVDVGGTVVHLATSASHTCALLDTSAVRCWGYALFGQLGYGNTDNIGDNETPASAGDVDVGGTVVHLAAGSYHTCALLNTGAVRCWGYAVYGQLGYANTSNIGDDETPASAGDVDISGTVVRLIAGGYHTCALLDTGAVRCWGHAVAGQLGYANTDNIGDNETPATAGDIDIGVP